MMQLRIMRQSLVNVPGKPALLSVRVAPEAVLASSRKLPYKPLQSRMVALHESRRLIPATVQQILDAGVLVGNWKLVSRLRLQDGLVHFIYLAKIVDSRCASHRLLESGTVIIPGLGGIPRIHPGRLLDGPDVLDILLFRDAPLWPRTMR
jgi:hypothetical protein